MITSFRNRVMNGMNSQIAGIHNEREESLEVARSSRDLASMRMRLLERSLGMQRHDLARG